MKKYFVLASAITVVTIINTSCDKEGVYNPKEKISMIYVENDDKSKELSETWTWENRLLAKVENVINENNDVYEYNTKKQLVKVTSYDDNNVAGYTTFTYDKSILTTMEIYKDKAKIGSITIDHDGKKIVKLTAQYNEVSVIESQMQKSSQSAKLFYHIMQLIVGKQIVDQMPKNIQKSTSYTVTLEFTYDGDNVVSSTLTSPSETMTSTYTYDSYLNPFYDMLFSNNENFSIPYSKNNVLKIESTTKSGSTSVVRTLNYKYTYEGKFPIKVETTIQYSSMPDFKITTINYYEYVN
jgi:hypothetical protein